jgi:predicted dehydrogenase
LLERKTVVIAEKQMLVYDEVAQEVTIYNKGVDEQLKNRDEGSETVPVAEAQPLRIECQHFLDCISKGQRPRSDGWNGVAVVEILEKATEALRG